MSPRRSIVILVNPRAGWGGLLGAPGSDYLTDPPVYRGPSYKAMVLFLKALSQETGARVDELPLIPAPGALGEWAVEEAMGQAPPRTSGVGEGLLDAARRFLGKECGENKLLVFSGGDGTAFEASKAWDCGAPLLGVPGGSKMYSSVFAFSPSAAARAARLFLEGSYVVEEALVVLVDERRLVWGEWVVLEERVVPTVGGVGEVRQEAKETPGSPGEEVESLAQYLVEVLPPGTPVVLGPGGLMTRVSRMLGWGKPFAAFAAGVVGGRPHCASCGSRELYDFVTGYGGRVRVLLSILGRTGFLLGRATRALTPIALERAGGARALLVASPASKLALLRVLRVDSSYRAALGNVGYLRVLASPGEYWVKRVEYV